MKIFRFISFCVLGVIAAVFLILGSYSTEVPAPPGFTVVEYWEKWAGNEAAQMKIIVDDFNNTVGRQKKIFVRYMSMTEIDQKTLISISAGVPPDVVGTWDAQIPQYAAIGAAEPLDAMAAADGITADYYLPVYWRGCHYKGHLYALVSTPGTVALLYNKQTFQQCAQQLRDAGLDPNRPPRTLQEFDRYSAVFDAKAPNGEIRRMGYLPMQSWYEPELSYWFGGDMFNEKTQKMTLDSPATIAAFKWIQSYSHRLGGQKLLDFQNSIGNIFDSPQNPFVIGELVMQQQGPWMANFIWHLKPSMSQILVPKDQEWKLPDRKANYAWAFAPFPSAVPGLENVSYNPFDALMIPAGAKHPKEAFEFIAYINREDVSEKLNTLHCKNCQLRHVSESFIKNHPNPYIKVFQDLAASPNARGLPRCPIWPEMYKELEDTGQAVTLGADPVAALKAAQQRMQEKWARFHSLELQRHRLGID